MKLTPAMLSSDNDKSLPYETTLENVFRKSERERLARWNGSLLPTTSPISWEEGRDIYAGETPALRLPKHILRGYKVNLSG